MLAGEVETILLSVPDGDARLRFRATLVMPAPILWAGESKSPKVQESHDRLKEVQRDLGREREKAREAGQKEASLAKELARLDKELKRKTEALQDLEGKLRGSSQRIGKLTQEIASAETRLTRSRSLLKSRLRAMPPVIVMLFGSLSKTGKS